MILRAFVALGLVLHAAATPLWPHGRVLVRKVDSVLEHNVSRVFEEIERKTLVRFVRKGKGGLAIRAASKGASAAGAPKATELCCFDAGGGAPMLRQLTLAVVRALGADPEAIARALSTRRLGRGKAAAKSPLLLPEEADAINELYAAEVLPPISALPARVEVGVWQLVEAYSPKEWADMVEGRGRRVVQGTMRWARGVAADGQMAGLVGAIPTFIFSGNKAEVVLLGPESAELVPGSALPSETPGEGLGAGIRRVMQHARGLTGRGFAGGLPTYLGDASALLLRSSCAEIRLSTIAGVDAEVVIQDHRSAVAWAQVSRWAQGFPGALLGIPSFAQPLQAGDAALDPHQTLEVLVLHGPGQQIGPEPGRTAAAISGAPPLAEPSGGGGPSLGLLLAALWGAAGIAGACCLLSTRNRRSNGHLSRAERDLERLVSNL
mmetsp:Transcript_50261/g.132862  ORF Transcript_50261/g.132862 Transcript_50261/m.132862 type:complete len:436 (-) Transcript_50261:31-1338(-)